MRIDIEKIIMVAQLDIHDIPAQAFGVRRRWSRMCTADGQDSRQCQYTVSDGEQ
jgi:hypothetical protein